MPSQQPLSSITRLYSAIKLLLGLKVEFIRLKTTEKLTIILAAIAFYAVAMTLGLVCVIFLSIGLGKLLAEAMAPYAAYWIIAAIYLVAFVLVFVLKRQIFVDPIARFMSRLLVEVPEEERDCNMPQLLAPDNESVQPQNLPSHGTDTTPEQ